MKGFFFLLFTISLLVMTQVQSGMADTTMSMTPGHMNTVNTTTPSNVPTKSIPGRTTSKTMGKTTSNTISRTTSRTTTSMTTKKFKSAAPALSSLGMGSVLLFLTNTLLQQFHLH